MKAWSCCIKNLSPAKSHFLFVLWLLAASSANLFLTSFSLYSVCYSASRFYSRLRHLLTLPCTYSNSSNHWSGKNIAAGEQSGNWWWESPGMRTKHSTAWWAAFLLLLTTLCTWLKGNYTSVSIHALGGFGQSNSSQSECSMSQRIKIRYMTCLRGWNQHKS